MPLSTDSGDMPNFWFPFAAANKRLQDGGWARQVTVNELPIAKSLAAVDMYLTAGAVRELHWHLPAEWAFVLYGNARITGFDQDGRSFVADVNLGDLWNFPSGIPHSIQGLDPDGTEFLSYSTTAVSRNSAPSWSHMDGAHAGGGLGEKLWLPVAAFNPIPLHEKYIFQAAVPGSLSEDQKAATGPQGDTPESFSYALLKQPPNFSSPHGEVRIVDFKKVPDLLDDRGRPRHRPPGAMRELHWHPNADEWQYYIVGSGRMGIFAAGNKIHTKDFHAGDVGYVPRVDGPLRREHRQHRPGISRSLPQQLLRVDLICAVAEPFAARAWYRRTSTSPTTQ